METNASNSEAFVGLTSFVWTTVSTVMQIIFLYCVFLYTGEGFFREGEGADVRAVWRNAAINAEAFAGN